MRFFKSGKTYDFMGSRRWFALFSIATTLVSLFVMWKPGPKWGTDFKGGTEVEVAFKQPVQEEQLRAAVQESGFSQPDVIRVQDASNPHRFLLRVQEVSTIDAGKQREIERALCFGEGVDTNLCPESARSTEVKFSPGGEKITVRYVEAPDLERIRTQLSGISGVVLREGLAERQSNPFVQNARENRVEIHLKSKGDQLMDGLKQKLGPEVVPDAPMRVEWIGPKAGAQLREAAAKSIAIAVVFIMIYIALRFDLRFAPGCVVSLLHDAICTVGILVLIGREINLVTVAALLTVVGYSVNDTVVVYDRVRENIGKLRGTGFEQIINVSLSEMLGRTLLTGTSAIFSLLAFFLWGTGALKDFALTLIIGTLLGTYSSIYVALPFTHFLDRTLFSQFSRGGAPKPPIKKESAVL